MMESEGGVVWKGREASSLASSGFGKIVTSGETVPR